MKKKAQFNPFLVFSNQFKTLLLAARNNENPALYLYKNGGRNVIFMLEGLTRLHKEAFGDAKMEKWHNRFKMLEDLIGQVDYFDAFRTQFEAEKILETPELAILTKKTALTLNEINTILIEKAWFDKKMTKFDVFIADKKYKYDDNYIAKITAAYKNDINEVVEIVHKINFKIKHIEEDLHELRRKLRWLSIYPQAFQGIFQLQQESENPAWATKYMTEATVNSPFNKLPQAVKHIPIIHLSYHSFMALSYIIQAFGEMKDKGLKNEILMTEFHFSPQKVKKIMGKNYASKEKIMADSSAMLATFFEDKVLETLVKS